MNPAQESNFQAIKKVGDEGLEPPPKARGKQHTSLGALQKVIELAAILEHLDSEEQAQIQEILDRHGAEVEREVN